MFLIAATADDATASFVVFIVAIITTQFFSNLNKLQQAGWHPNNTQSPTTTKKNMERTRDRCEFVGTN